MLILASKSKARRKLLENAGIDHQVIASNVDESCFIDSNVKHLVQSLAQAKSKDVFSKIHLKNKNFSFETDYFYILGCDSLFTFKGEVFGKPKSHSEAANRLRLISDQEGELHTGHSLIMCEKSFREPFVYNFRLIVEKVITSKILFSKFSDFDIQEYVNSNEPMECAGGFSLERKGSLYIERVEGCFSNIIGLSLPWLRKTLYSLK